jgi:molybdopterin-biosynthesis enzyme MoeA-like protein
MAEAIRALSKRSRFLISSGGVGPTHDDVTFLAYAAAFDTELTLHPELASGIQAYYGGDAPESALRMARVPANTELVTMPGSKWPIIKVANCFVLPGLPEIFVKKFAAVVDWLPPVPDRYYGEICTTAPEVSFAETLTRLQEDYPNVELGSYPTFDQTDFSARVTFKSQDAEAIQVVFEKIKDYFQKNQSLANLKEPAKQ